MLGWGARGQEVENVAGVWQGDASLSPGGA